MSYLSPITNPDMQIIMFVIVIMCVVLLVKIVWMWWVFSMQMFLINC